MQQHGRVSPRLDDQHTWQQANFHHQLVAQSADSSACRLPAAAAHQHIRAQLGRQSNHGRARGRVQRRPPAAAAARLALPREEPAHPTSRRYFRATESHTQASLSQRQPNHRARGQHVRPDAQAGQAPPRRQPHQHHPPAGVRQLHTPRLSRSEWQSAQTHRVAPLLHARVARTRRVGRAAAKWRPARRRLRVRARLVQAPAVADARRAWRLQRHRSPRDSLRGEELLLASQ